MTYETVKQLPATIRDVLPDKAKEIYRKAYNQAWEDLTTMPIGVSINQG
jgi:cation transport regulator ChaB